MKNRFVLVSVLAVIALAGTALLSQREYNRAVGLEENVRSEWAELDNQFKRRFDLLPNLASVVKGIARQEETVYLGIAEARKAYFQARSVGEKAAAAGRTEEALSRLLLLSETYPELKSDGSFLRLQEQVEGTENRLAVARKRYNDAVTRLNAHSRSFPGHFFARLAGVERAEYFTVSEEQKAVPELKF